MNDSLVQVTHKELLNLLMSGDRSKCSELVRNYLNNGASIEVL